VTERDSGSILDGKYEILDRLATGGMGDVYRARHLHLHEDRVIKILRADKATDPHAMQRFVQEARIATQIKHPNVAILYDFARLADGSFYMVWEHIAGEDVGATIRKQGHLQMALAVDLAIQALRGLDAIHSAGVIHRDISPDNLMIARDRRGKALVKIIDLGLAKNLEAAAGLEITQAGMFMGKLMYCSPEQAGSLADAPLDHRSDLYSLAAVIYEMVTGKPPFDSETAHGYVLKRLSQAPLSMVGRTPGVMVPKSLEEVVMRGLARNREERWPDALAFLQALVRVADQLRQVSTQEVPAQTPGAGTAGAAAGGVSARGGARPSASELSREERLDLLAQIDRAAKRVSESGRLHEEIRQAIDERRLDDAQEMLATLESVAPRYAGLQELRGVLAAARSGAAPPTRTAAAAPAAPALPQVDAEQQARVAEAERMLEKYMREQKQSLARFALDALLDLDPNHPRRVELTIAVNQVGQEGARLRSAEAALDEGRDAMIRGDLAAARRRLEEIDRFDPSRRLGDPFRRELEEAEQRSRADAEMDRRRERLEQMIDSRRVAEAQKELERLVAAGLARVSVESYRLRIGDLAALAERELRAQELERQCRERLVAHDWQAGRDLVMEIERILPDSSRPGQLFAEITRLEEVQRHQQGIDQGLKQLEAFIAQRKIGEAEMALRILGQMAPDLRELRELELRVRALRGR